MIGRIRQRAGAVLRRSARWQVAPTECPSDRLRLSILSKPGYDGVTFGFDPGETP